MSINVIKDTKIIEDNTKDSLAVEISTDTVIQGTEYDTGKEIIKGDNLIRVNKATLNLGSLKEKKSQIENQFISLQGELDEINANIALIEPVLDQAITDILKESESIDNRTK